MTSLNRISQSFLDCIKITYTVRKTGVSQHNGGPIKGPFNSSIRQYYDHLKGFKRVLMMPRDASLSSAQCYDRSYCIPEFFLCDPQFLSYCRFCILQQLTATWDLAGKQRSLALQNMPLTLTCSDQGVNPKASGA